MKVFIYKLWFREEPKTIYIGITTNLKKRLQNHLCDTNITRKTNWLKSRFNKGLEFTYSIIHVAATEDEALLVEQQTIAYYKKEGYILKNSTDGGEGQLGKQWSAESRAKVGLATKNRVIKDSTRLKVSKRVSGVNHPMYGKRGKDSPNFGRVFSEESKSRISDALVGKKKSETARANMSKAKEKKLYEMLSPTGEIFVTSNIKTFSKEHNLSHSGVYAMLKGNQSNVKGWTGRYL